MPRRTAFHVSPCPTRRSATPLAVLLVARRATMVPRAPGQRPMQLLTGLPAGLVARCLDCMCAQSRQVICGKVLLPASRKGRDL